MNINQVYSKSLQKMLERKLLFKCQIKQLQLQQKQRQNKSKKSNPKKKIKDISRQLSPRNSRIRQILKFQTHQPQCLQKQVDQILKVMTQQCQQSLQKRLFSKRFKYENYRISTQQNDNPQKSTQKKKKRVNSQVTLPKIGKAFQIAQDGASSNRLKAYIHQQKNHEIVRHKTENQVETVRNITKHYRVGAISTKQLHKNFNNKYF